MSKPFVTRFAPSPTGFLHLGHAYSALIAYNAAIHHNGQFLLRIEDIDRTRCHKKFEQAIYDDLAWLGLKWIQPTRRQSEHFEDYEEAVKELDKLGVLYPCFCTRKDIAKEIQESGRAPHNPGNIVYPGTCKHLSKDEIKSKTKSGSAFALRINIEKASNIIKQPLSFHDKEHGHIHANPALLGDVVIARKNIMTSYHLSAVVDDHLQGITHVIRGNDLFKSTHIHRLLQELLGYQPPFYYHHELLTGKDRKRFAKRDKSLTLQSLRNKQVPLNEISSMMLDSGAKIRFDLPLNT